MGCGDGIGGGEEVRNVYFLLFVVYCLAFEQHFELIKPFKHFEQNVLVFAF